MLFILSLIACKGEVEDTAACPDGPLLTFYADVDGDGYGDPDAAVEACEAEAGTVDNSLDCDDGDAAVNPDGVEICDGVDNDCDAATPDAGASWEKDGSFTDMADAWQGADGAVAGLSLTEPGTLHVCEGEHFMWLELKGSVSVVGHGDAILNAQQTESVVVIRGTDLAVSLQDITLTGGDSGLRVDELLGDYRGAGGVNCIDQGQGTLSLSGVTLDGNVGDLGGNLSTYSCRLDAQNVEITGGQATYGAGAALIGADDLGSFSDSHLHGNVSADIAGALMTLGYVESDEDARELPDPATLVLSDTLVSDNTSDEVGGGIYAVLTDLRCESSGGEHGFLRNSAGAAGAAFLEYSPMESAGCDFGADDNDNAGFADIYVDGIEDSAWTAQDDADFSCDLETCTGDVVAEELD